ncbi:MAG: sodium:proton antiporter [Gammaproteobacteria bacterium HGW-Gammaproteobacteria-2]|jgi:NhaP-type Na+/H+ or K+/H+ antiporter|nr:MAG: sodium:proton antiporter [Gammaproteobacteria bacterium HGW-Gammaproteobacteria-2]
MPMSLGLMLAALLALGLACQWLAWRLKLPAILFLLVAGLMLGPATGLLDPDVLLGDLLFPFVSLGVAIILFEGSLTLRLGEIRGLGPSILRLVSVGALITMLGLAWVVHAVADLSWPLSLLFGALCSVTGPTVIVPMLRSVRPNERIANVLRWEGIVIDPIGALLAVLVFEALALGHGHQGVAVFVWTVALGSGIGLAAAFALAYVLRHHLLPEYLHNYATLALVLLTFTLTNAFADESGLLAVTVMGMTLANLRGLHMEDILDFKENLSTLVISMLFIILAARLDWPSPQVFGAGLLVLAAAILVVRPLAVLVSTLGGKLTWPERALIAWIAPRGIVAASVSALFALKLEERGIADAQMLVTLTFLIIIGTVLIQSATARRLALRLGVAEPEPRGVLIVGSSVVARGLAEVLHKLGFAPLLADDSWPGIRAARMAGLRTFHGNPISEHADRRLDLIGIGWLLALSTRVETNTLACIRYQPEFGRDHVYRLRVLAPGEAPKQAQSNVLQAPALFGDAITHAQMERRMNDGWSLKTTRLTDTFSWTDFTARCSRTPMLLFAVTERGQLRFETEHMALQPKAGWTACVLAPPENGSNAS